MKISWNFKLEDFACFSQIKGFRLLLQELPNLIDSKVQWIGYRMPHLCLIVSELLRTLSDFLKHKKYIT